MTEETETAPQLTVRRSKSIAQLVAGLSAAQGAFKILEKSGYDSEQARSYSEIGDYITATREALSKHGVSVMQFPNTGHGYVTVTTTLAHKSGQWIESDLRMDVFEQDGNSGPREYTASVTYARRIALAAVLQIASDGEKVRVAGDLASLRSGSAGEPFINPAQGAQFWRTAQESGKTQEQVNGYLKSITVEVTEKMPRSKFPAAIRWAAEKEERLG